MRRLISLAIAFGIVLMPAVASAHAVVSPASAQAGERQLFTMSTPNERDNDVVKLKLDVPAGMQEVSPTIAAGWTIATTQSKGSITSITWDGGLIPPGQRADFTLSAVVPSRTGELHWKVYQTYSDGVVVSWNKPQTTAQDDDNPKASEGPYSTTTIKNVEKNAREDAGYDLPTLCIAVTAIVMSVWVLMRSKTRRS
ncbi:MAG TPA: DUF1775 domain-containing protein [Bacillota bacterium]|nr:DUF1775 domain-containing protein [Bacillota bacterium]